MAMRALTVPRTADDLLLAVEILSPSTAAVDRGQKRQLYMSAGVDQFWIVDLEARMVEVWRPGAILGRAHAVGDALLWQPVVSV